MTTAATAGPDPLGETPPDIASLVGFLMEVDLLKSVERRGLVPAQGWRRENSAEHSWHVSLIAMMLHPRLSQPVDLLQTLKLIAIHDLCEIHAGDAYAYDPAAQAGQAEREAASAARVFAHAGPGDEAALHALRDVFEAAETPEARFAHACDRIAGFMQNIIGEGVVWKELGIARARTYVRMAPPLTFDPATAALVKALYALADDRAMWGDGAAG